MCPRKVVPGDAHWELVIKCVGRKGRGQEVYRHVSVRPRHGVRSPISGAYCLFACDDGDYSELPLCDEILRIGS
jgi:hypothetical protein